MAPTRFQLYGPPSRLKCKALTRWGRVKPIKMVYFRSRRRSLRNAMGALAHTDPVVHPFGVASIGYERYPDRGSVSNGQRNQFVTRDDGPR